MTGADYDIFLSLVKECLSGSLKQDEIKLDAEQWERILTISDEHDILSLVLDRCVLFESIKTVSGERLKELKQRALKSAVRQIVKTNEFLTLIAHAHKQGLESVIIKGVVLSSLYPKPMLRSSVDDDLIISPSETGHWHDFLISEGLVCDIPDADPDGQDELSYHRYNSPTYIEIHKTLFPDSSAVYGDLNELLKDALNRTTVCQIEDVTIKTLAPADHFLYLICHAYKHFIHSGIGIRSIADISLFAEAYINDIDWGNVYLSCRSAGIEVFAAALLRICNKYLTLSCVPLPFNEIKVDEGQLLEDTLSGGLFGTADPSRVHSSNITLDAAASRINGNRHQGMFRSIFPGKEYLMNSFPYAKRHPFLLPAAWMHRIINYIRRTPNVINDSVKTLKTGRERTELLRIYKLIG